MFCSYVYYDYFIRVLFTSEFGRVYDANLI